MMIKYFPLCTYHGIDRENYNVDERHAANLGVFYRADLDTDSLDMVPNNFFDLIIMNHVLEHLNAPETVLFALPKGARGIG